MEKDAAAKQAKAAAKMMGGLEQAFQKQLVAATAEAGKATAEQQTRREASDAHATAL